VDLPVVVVVCGVAKRGYIGIISKCSDWKCVRLARMHSIRASIGKCSRHRLSDNLPCQASVDDRDRHAKPVICVTSELLAASWVMIY
jgi:hypothetical protein